MQYVELEQVQLNLSKTFAMHSPIRVLLPNFVPFKIHPPFFSVEITHEQTLVHLMHELKNLF